MIFVVIFWIPIIAFLNKCSNVQKETVNFFPELRRTTGATDRREPGARGQRTKPTPGNYAGPYNLPPQLHDICMIFSLITFTSNGQSSHPFLTQSSLCVWSQRIINCCTLSNQHQAPHNCPISTFV